MYYPTRYACLVLAAAVFAEDYECGRTMAFGQSRIANGVEAKYGSFPWHVGIYRETDVDKYDQICGGTLVRTDLVISAAHCLYDDSLRVVEDPRKFRVAGGKLYRELIWPERYAQQSGIRTIDIRDGYSGQETNYDLDIALLHLDTPFTLTTFVRTVCIDWDNMYRTDQLQDGKIGKVVGWGLNASGVLSHELQEAQLPFVNKQDCISAIPTEFGDFVGVDKICAGYLNGTSVCPGDSGGGLCFESNGIWFLRGIVSMSSRSPVNDRPCETTYYTTFTDVGYHLDSIRSVYFSQGNREIEQGGCVIPDHPAGGRITQISCRTSPCDVEPGCRVPWFSVLIYECDIGYNRKGPMSSQCYNDVWSPGPPTCVAHDAEPSTLCSEDTNYL